MMNESQNDHTQSLVSATIDPAAMVPKKVASRLMESCRPMAIDRC